MEEPVRTQHSIPHRVFRERVAEDIAGAVSLPVDAWVDIYRAMWQARVLDQLEAELAARGEAFFHLPCTGHEGMAALRPCLRPDDWLHLHYRDKALILALGVPTARYLDDLVSNAASHSQGRQMPPFLCDPARNLLAQNIPVGNHALQAVGAAAALARAGGEGLVLCTMGDGATQQGEVLEAIAEAVRECLPILFVVEDNQYSISTRTAGRTFYSLPEWCGPADALFGLGIHYCDGRDPLRLHGQLGPVLDAVRLARAPGLAVVQVERLASHTNADDERVYRSESERSRARETGDPVIRLRQSLLELGVAEGRLEHLERQAEAAMRESAEAARQHADPVPEFGARRPLPPDLVDPACEHRGVGSGPRLTMIEAIRETLRAHLEADPRVTLAGQDIEDPKGDVFGVTRGLSTAFPGRVRNAALSESTILGTAIGRALAGERPVAFIQFADFLPLAYNQIQNELGSMYWRTAGALECPVIVLVACGGYRPGLGPFHAQTLESVMAHVPGVDVFMPSSAADAAGLLNAAFRSGRPTIMFYPKTCLNDRERTTSADVTAQLVPVGTARRVQAGDDLTLVTWGSTVRHAELAAAALAEAGVGVDLLDLRCLSPWDEAAVCESANRTRRLIVVHEDNRTCGFGAEVLATVAERLDGRVTCRRLTRPDTLVPYNFANQLEVLPSFTRLMETAADLLGRPLTWEAPASRPKAARHVVEARGPSPADQAVTIVDWNVQPGDRVEPGGVLADMEADKAVYELVAPVAGRVAALRAAPGEQVPTGRPLLEIELDHTDGVRTRPTREEPGIPRLGLPLRSAQTRRRSRGETAVGLFAPSVALGSATMDNAEIVRRFPGRTPEDIVKRTGIAARRRLAPGETVLDLAVRASQAALDAAGLDLHDVDAIICSTGSPQFITPSLACLVLNRLAVGLKAREIPAYDLSAACSGYLYALAAAWDQIQSRPASRILVVTAEALSPLANPDEFETAIIFGDAATATLLQGDDAAGAPVGLLRRPVLSAKGEPGEVLRVPVPGGGFIRMDGTRVYAEAVRAMIAVLELACAEAGIAPGDLDRVVPHQANSRIIGDIQRRLKMPIDRVVVQLRDLGNTSSSSIPICLAELAAQGSGGRLGLTAFGGGYTSAAAILDLAVGGGPR